MKISKKIFLLLCGSVTSSLCYAQSSGQTVTPRQLFPSSVLNVHSPDAEGWVITGAASNGVSFGKRGTESGETYGAQVVIFELPATASSEEFVGFVKKRIATMNPSPRFQETRSKYQYSESRGYPCVSVHIDFDDTAALTPEGKQQLKLQVFSLYCRHPAQKQLGFFAAYSYRGKAPDSQLEAAALSFIDGVHVPKS